MDKDTVLTHILNTKGVSTLIGGQLPIRVINNSEYIPPLAQVTERNVEGNLPSVDHVIHSALSGQIKKVILVGEGGSGKTTALEKLVVDWAKGECLQNFSYVFYFQLRELNSVKRMHSLLTLMQHHYSHIPPKSVPGLLQSPEAVLFVFDDLDKYKHNLDPSVHTLCSDPLQAVSVSCLMTSLLHGSLLKGAAFVIATRPTACVKFSNGTSVKVLGFLKPQREAYFKGFFTEATAASKALKHMERTLGFYEFCTSPRFCWTACSIYKTLMDAGRSLPETLSQLYVDILAHLIQALSLNKCHNKDLVLALSRMATHCCLNQHSNCIIEEMESFDFPQFLSSSGVFLPVDGDVEKDMCVFSPQSQIMLEFILAVSFFLDKSTSGRVELLLEKHKDYTEFLDLFLSGLLEPSQRRPLETLLGEFNSDRIVNFKSWLKSSSEATLKANYIDTHRHCFRLLHQAQDKSLVKEITSSALVGTSYGNLSLDDCVALNYVITCHGEMKQLNLYNAGSLTEEKAEVLAPAMSLSYKIVLINCSLDTGAIPHLASALSRGITTELDLSHTSLGDEKLSILCVGLRHCKLLKLNLQACCLTSCDDLASVLTSGTSQLCVLNIMCNSIGDQAFMKLCTALHSPHCKLQEIWLRQCQLTAASMDMLAAALCSGQSVLRKVDLTNNTVGDSGVKALCKSLHHPCCKLQNLILFDNELTGACCPHLTHALMSEQCSLSELDLSVNDLGQEGVLLLCQALSQRGCPIKKLGLTRCELTQSVFKELGSVLRSGTSKIESLIVGINKVGDQGVKHLWDAVAHPSCQLVELDVEMTCLTDACVEDLCAAVRASKSLKSLELRNNSLTDASVPALVQVMQDSDNMQEMNLKYNNFSEEVFDILEECKKIIY